jgi:hypothetical protein
MIRPAKSSYLSVGKVALWLGDEGNPTMLHRHYRGLATKADSDAFFALRPNP